MPNTQLLSEIDPLSTMDHEPSKPRFAPTDLNRGLRQGTRTTGGSAVLIELFQAEIRVLHRHAEAVGQYLVLRDHTHSHYCTSQDPASRPTLRDCLPPELRVRAVTTVRNPAESFVSLQELGWLHIEPPTFDAYCQRYLMMLDANRGVPIVRYEDFVVDPERTMRRICEVLELPYGPDFQLLISAMRLTGDSGRSSDVIAPRQRRSGASKLAADSMDLASYRELLHRLGYDEKPLNERSQHA